jgi:3-methyladenine DNA glycosylase AlkD
MNKTIGKIRKELLNNADKKIKESSKRFFKEPIKVYGMKNALVEKIAKKYWSEVKDLPKNEIYDLSEELFASGYMEEAFIPCVWLPKMVKVFEKNDIMIFEKWIDKYIDNWAKCDTFCNHTVGDYMMKFPEKVNILFVWAKPKNRWMKRAAAVTLIVPARKGLFLKEIFGIADTLLLDRDDLVQKGYGWMLKAASQTHQNEVLQFVMERKDRMPRTALRYAIEKMPPDLRRKAMSK